ncbi:hypothetical protein E2562_027096 [Oryza meyeriana var. granulata]|uniref:Uncharacterized protein n=1 Tax=Oryza meyeriana var. granulata TaxID=110450 RepID=A0A6G1EZ89_9ORYZ|nr:hypothetical protein E2562_027096 [Oryza meyeriana var. granulata]
MHMSASRFSPPPRASEYSQAHADTGDSGAHSRSPPRPPAPASPTPRLGNPNPQLRARPPARSPRRSPPREQGEEGSQPSLQVRAAAVR